MVAGVKKGTVRGSYTPKIRRIEYVRSLSLEQLIEFSQGCSTEHQFLYKITRNERYYAEAREIVTGKGFDFSYLAQLKKESIRKRNIEAGLGQTRRGIERIKKNLSIIFCENSSYDSKTVRKIFSKYNKHFKWVPQECELCRNPGIHNGRPLTLQVDHKNGISSDHRLKNLRFLCPNCHSQSDTYCWKNMHRKRRESLEGRVGLEPTLDKD